MTSTRKFMAKCAVDGAALGSNAFSHGPAVWVGQREVAHFDADGALDVRLTRAVIRGRRHELRTDERITLRGSSSDWLEVRITHPADEPFAEGLVRDAIAASRAGAPPGPPPTGAALARRRRCH